MSATPVGFEPVRARSALARIGLAATRLAREASTPAMQALVESITDAVEQLDRALGDAPSPLGAAPAGGAADADLATTLDAVRPRLEPALAAREIALEIAPPTEAIRGDASLLRQAVAQLVRGAARVLAPGGRIALRLRGEASRFGVEVALEAPAGAVSDLEAAHWLEAPHALARRWHGTLEQTAGAGSPSVTLWLPRELPACSAS